MTFGSQGRENNRMSRQMPCRHSITRLLPGGLANPGANGPILTISITPTRPNIKAQIVMGHKTQGGSQQWDQGLSAKSQTEGSTRQTISGTTKNVRRSCQVRLSEPNAFALATKISGGTNDHV